MRRLFFLNFALSKLFFLLTSLSLKGQINIDYSQGFEGVGVSSLGSSGITIWTYTQVGGSQSSGNNNTPGNPAGVALASQGSNGLQLNNTTNNPETCIVTFDNITFAASDTRMVEFRLAGMGKDDNEGIDSDDYVDVEVSFNNGVTWQHEIRIQLTGSTSNVGYGFGLKSTFSKIANNTLTNVDYLPAWVRVLLPNGSTQVRLRITLRNNQDKERWVIDDVRCGTIPRAPVVADFENASTAPQWSNFNVASNTNVGIPEGNTNTTGTISTGNNNNPGNPASAPLYAPAHAAPPTPNATQVQGFQLDNTTNGSLICARAFDHTYIKEGNHNYVEFRLAGMGKAANQGIDSDDFVELQVSINGGPYTREIRVRGNGNNSNNGWGFGSSGLITVFYEGDLSPTLYSTPASATIAISTIRLILPSHAFQVAARIVMRNNNNQERWVIDNVRLFSDPNPPAAPPVPIVTFAYEGFDYYEYNEDVSDANFASTKNQKTVASVFPTFDISLHTYMTDFNNRYATTNAPTSLGWAEDWRTSDASDSYYIGGILVGDQSLVQSASYPIISDDQSNSLVNSGLFLQTKPGTTSSIGRRLQTSTGGSFFLYNIKGAPLPQNTNPVTSGALEVHPASPIIFSNASPASAIPTTHKNVQNTANASERTTTNNTRIGAHGSTIWFAVMMRKGANDNNPIFVSLHKHGTWTTPPMGPPPYHAQLQSQVWDTGPTGAIQVGYFGTNGSNPRHWAVRVNGNIYYAGQNNTNHPTANNTNTRIQTSEEDIPTPGNPRGDEWDLLVLEIKYDYGNNKDLNAGGANDDNHRIRMYVIRDYKRNTHPADPDAGLGGIVESGANFTQFVADPASLDTMWDIEITGLKGDLTFHSLAFRGSGGYTGPSGLPGVTADLYFSDAIDEIRFGSTFEAAVLYSPTVSLIRGLCEQNGGTPGVNVFPEGTFGIAESLTPEGFLATNVTVATQSFEGSGSSVAQTGNTGIEWNYTPALLAANFSAGNNAATGTPSSAPLYSDGNRGIQLLNTTGNTETLTITTASVALPKSPTVNGEYYIVLDLAGMGNAAGEGVDNTGDQIVLAVSINGAAYQDEVTIVPSGVNVGWNLGGGVTGDPAIGANNTITTNPGRVRINLPAGTNTVSLRITMQNDAINERWVVDNIRLEALNTGVVGEQVATENGSRYAPSENPNAKLRNGKILAGTDCPDGNNANCPVVFENGTALIGDPPIAYNALTGPNYIYTFNQNNQPNDGAYMIANRTGHMFGSSNANPSWYPVYDNTNENKNGMLMNINAAYAKSEFYSKIASSICADTQYEFYVDIFNTLRAVRRTITNYDATQGAQACDPRVEPGCSQMSFAGTDQTGNSGIGAASHGDNGGNASNSYLINPEVQFLINSKPLYTPPISVSNAKNGSKSHVNPDLTTDDNPAEWRRMGLTFITKSSVNSVNVSFRNIAPGGSGNDLAIDNISFRPCGPRSRIRQTPANPNNYCLDGDNLQLDIGAIGAGFTNPHALWQYSCDGGNTWNNLPLQAPLSNPMPINIPYTDVSNGFFTGSSTTPTINIYNLSPASNPNPGVPDPNKPLTHGCMIRVIFAGNLTNLSNERCRFIAGPITINCLDPLSATHINASAKLQNNGIAVRWYLPEEVEMKQYIVERSVDMFSFVPITHVMARNTGQTYIYVDVVPFEGRNYYRIKGIKQNGEEQYSNIVSEEWKGQGGINFYPNPADKGVYVAFSKTFDQREQIRVRLITMMGAEVERRDYYLEYPQKTIYINTERLPEGLYVVEIEIAGYRYVSKLVIKR